MIRLIGGLMMIIVIVAHSVCADSNVTLTNQTVLSQRETKMSRFQRMAALCLLKSLKKIPTFKPIEVQQCCGSYRYIHCLKSLKLANECRIWVEDEITSNEERLSNQGFVCDRVDEIADCGIGSQEEQREFDLMRQRKRQEQNSLCSGEECDYNFALVNTASLLTVSFTSMLVLYFR